MAVIRPRDKRIHKLETEIALLINELKILKAAPAWMDDKALNTYLSYNQPEMPSKTPLRLQTAVTFVMDTSLPDIYGSCQYDQIIDIIYDYLMNAPPEFNVPKLPKINVNSGARYCDIYQTLKQYQALVVDISIKVGDKLEKHKCTHCGFPISSGYSTKNDGTIGNRYKCPCMSSRFDRTYATYYTTVEYADFG